MELVVRFLQPVTAKEMKFRLFPVTHRYTMGTKRLVTILVVPVCIQDDFFFNFQLSC